MPEAILFVTDYGTVDQLQDTLVQLPGNLSVVDTVDCEPGEARVVVHGGAGFLRFALEHQGYAKIVREG